MNTQESLAALAREAGWQVFPAEPTRVGQTSQTYGIPHIVCLHVRYDQQGRVLNAIYVHFQSKHRRDQV